MEFLINAILFLWFFFVILTFSKYGFYENIFSPLNIYLTENIFGILIFFMFTNKLKLFNYLPAYFDEPKADDSVLIIVFLYFLSFCLVYFLLETIKYKPIYFNRNIKLLPSKYTLYLFAFFSMFYAYLLFKSDVIRNINFESMYQFRYSLLHGYIVLLNIFGFSFFYFIFLYVLNKIELQKKYHIFVMTLLPVWFLFLFFINARGPTVFGFLFALSFFKELNVFYILNKLLDLKINKKIFLILLLTLLPFGFYQWYSIEFRGLSGTFVDLVFQRMDNFIASYMVAYNNWGGFRLQNILYPIIYLIPRAIYLGKPFPPYAELSKDILGSKLLGKDAWTVNFGLAGESYYISFGLLTPLYSILIVLSLVYYRKLICRIYSSGYFNFFQFVLLGMLYGLPMAILMVGIFIPQIGNVIIVIFVKLFFNLLKLSKSSSKKEVYDT